jgi:hypothetical protein
VIARLSGDATTRAVTELAVEFDEFARPEHGWYVEQPVRG